MFGIGLGAVTDEILARGAGRLDGGTPPIEARDLEIGAFAELVEGVGDITDLRVTGVELLGGSVAEVEALAVSILETGGLEIEEVLVAVGLLVETVEVRRL